MEIQKALDYIQYIYIFPEIVVTSSPLNIGSILYYKTIDFSGAMYAIMLTNKNSLVLNVRFTIHTID